MFGHSQMSKKNRDRVDNQFDARSRPMSLVDMEEEAKDEAILHTQADFDA